MKKSLKINKDTITSVTSYVNKKDTFFEWKEGRFLLGITIRKPGFYTDFGLRFDPWEVESEYSDVFVRDSVVYFLPHIVMRTADGKTHTMYFDTEEYLKKFTSYHFNDSKWVDSERPSWA